MADLRAIAADPEELIRRANRGDREALAQLYRDHREWVTALAYRFTASHDDALDVLQETFAYFFAKFPGFSLRSSIRSFLYPVVKHSSINVIRKRRKLVALDTYRHIETDMEWRFPDTSGDLVRLVGRLSEGQRAVVRLRFGLGFRLDEIAEALEIPTGTVKSRLHNALKSLRTELEREDWPTNRRRS